MPERTRQVIFPLDGCDLRRFERESTSGSPSLAQLFEHDDAENRRFFAQGLRRLRLTVKQFKRGELATTLTLLKAIAAPAATGLSNPNAASRDSDRIEDERPKEILSDLLERSARYLQRLADQGAGRHASV